MLYSFHLKVHNDATTMSHFPLDNPLINSFNSSGLGLGVSTYYQKFRCQIGNFMFIWSSIVQIPRALYAYSIVIFKYQLYTSILSSMAQQSMMPHVLTGSQPATSPTAERPPSGGALDVERGRETATTSVSVAQSQQKHSLPIRG